VKLIDGDGDGGGGSGGGGGDEAERERRELAKDEAAKKKCCGCGWC
jgi:hypothetical protein